MKNSKNRFFAGRKDCFIVAEISANHGQDLDRALRMISEAGRCGADAVKFQTYTPDALTINADNRYFTIKHPKWGGQTLYQLYNKAYTPWGWFKKLKKCADDEGIVFFATSFDRRSVDLLEDLKVPLHKIASFELVDLPLIEYIAKTKKPLILSTGMATIQDIKEAVSAAKKGGSAEAVLLKCSSSYPACPGEMNLRTMADMKKRFKCTIGLSDHTLGIGVSVAAVSLGAKLIEKHFTMSRKLKTPDSFFSVEPQELKELVKNVRTAEEALGKIHYGLTENEKKSLVFRRSIFCINDIDKGELFSELNVASIRPSNGLKPKYLKKIIGRKAKRKITRGTPLKWDMIR